MSCHWVLPILCPVQPTQTFAYQARAGETVRFDLSSEDFDAFLWLTGPGFEGEPLSDDDGGAAGQDCRSTSVRTAARCTAARIEVTFPSSGQYVVAVTSLGGGVGAYTLSVS